MRGAFSLCQRAEETVATIVRGQRSGSSGIFLAIAFMAAVVALVVVNFAYNGQHVSETPVVEAPGTPAPPPAPTP